MSHAEATAPVGLVPALRSGGADVLRLAVAQALAGANSAIVYATGAVVGNTLAPSKALALVWPVAGLIQLRPQRHIIAMYAPSFFT